MNKITMQNRGDSHYKTLRNDLIQEVFGFTFVKWDALGLWDDRYESYSIIEDGKMLSNIFVYKVELLIGGKVFRAYQLGGVATRKDCRGQGLSRQIMEHILERYPETPLFLFANRNVLDFYPRFGFKRVTESLPYVCMSIDNSQAQVCKLALDSDIYASILYNRKIFSGMLDCTNTQSVQIFNVMMSYPDSIYHIPERGCIVIAKQDGDKLFIADIIAIKQIQFDALAPFLPFSGISRVEFGFCPDWLDVKCEWERITDDNDAMFIRGEWPLPRQFKVPATSIT